jgi:DNA-binding CsgD family transcriptional regulator
VTIVLAVTGIVPTDHGATDPEAPAPLTVSLCAGCSELVLHCELCQTHSQRAHESVHDLDNADPRAAVFRERFYSLSARQLDVFERILRGDANKAIAFDMKLNQKTVETHRARLMRKLQAESLVDLIRTYFMAFGLAGHPPRIRPASRRLRLASGAENDA